MEKIEAASHEAIERKVFPGCIVGIVTPHGRTLRPFGRHTYDADSPAITKDSLYDCASITKSVVTATLALQLLDEGKMHLEDTLQTYVPEYCSSEVTIWHLLTYTIGGLKLSDLKGKTPAEITTAALAFQPPYSPGTRFYYSNLPAFLLGFALENILGPLDLAAHERIFKPRNMSASTFLPHGAVPTEEGIQDIVHDESARVFAQVGRAVGHAGLFSTAPDLLAFLEYQLQHPDKRLTTNYIAEIGESSASGWELNQSWMGNARTPKTFGKTGFTGTAVVCDFERQIGIVILSNRTYPKRPPDNSAINAFRAHVCDIIATLI